MRIASLLPSATEIAFFVGAGKDVVAVSHECDFPSQAVGLPVLTRSAVETHNLSQAEIDAAITALLHDGGSTYGIDVPLLRSLHVDLILTQALCDVCAVGAEQVHRTVHEQHLGARVLTMTPQTLEGVFRSIEDVGEATGYGAAARTGTDQLRARVAALRASRPSRAPHVVAPRVVAIEWLDPPFIAGHWVPDQIEAAGGVDVLGVSGERSFRATWDDIVAADPEVVLILPCGYDLAEIVEQARALSAIPAWRGLRAVQDGAVWALNAGAWFSRPGPRVVEGIAVLQQIFTNPLTEKPLGGAQRLPASRAATSS